MLLFSTCFFYSRTHVIFVPHRDIIKTERNFFSARENAFYRWIKNREDFATGNSVLSELHTGIKAFKGKKYFTYVIALSEMKFAKDKNVFLYFGFTGVSILRKINVTRWLAMCFSNDDVHELF